MALGHHCQRVTHFEIFQMYINLKSVRILIISLVYSHKKASFILGDYEKHLVDNFINSDYVQSGRGQTHIKIERGRHPVILQIITFFHNIFQY